MITPVNLAKPWRRITPDDGSQPYYRNDASESPTLTCAAVYRLCQLAFCRFERRRSDGGFVCNVVLRRALFVCNADCESVGQPLCDLCGVFVASAQPFGIWKVLTFDVQ